MVGKLLIGGGFFTHPQMNFFDIITKNPLYNIHHIGFDELNGKNKIKIEEDFVVLLGIKGLVRMLIKKKTTRRQTINVLKGFFSKTIPHTIPLVVVDDFSLDGSKRFQKPLINNFLKNFNLKKYLLREYLSTKNYPNWIMPFSLPCNSNMELAVDNGQKEFDLFFHGNESSKDRVNVTKKLKKHFPVLKHHMNVTHGGVKNEKDRLPRNQFMKMMANSKLCLSFAGSGYDCYRYHEIASVGSLIVSPNYPLIIRNDYTDMVSCIKFKNVNSLKKKIKTLFDSSGALDEMQANSSEQFKKFHTSEVRAIELEEIVCGSFN
jgi:hypothetical protein